MTRKLLLGVAGAAMLSTSAVASSTSASAKDYFDLSPDELLSATVMSASKREEAVSDSPAAVYVITQEDISRSGLTSIPELLRLAPGVNVARTNGNTWAISIRGFQDTLANKLLVMIDGRTVYNPFFGGTFWDAQDYPLDDIDRIEVIRGPGGALWGANAVNGVINIITKKSQDTQGNMVKLGGGNYEQAFTTMRHGGRIGYGGSYRVYGKYADYAASKTVGANDQADDSWNTAHGGFRMDWGNESASPEYMTLHGDAYRVNSEGRTPMFSFTAPFETDVRDTIESRGANLMGAWRRNFDNGSWFNVQSYIDYTERHQILFQDNRTTMDTELQYSFAPAGRHEVTAGGGYRYIIDDIGGSELVNFSPASKKDSVVAAFLQDKITLFTDKLYLTLGSKFEHNDYTDYEVQPNARLSWIVDGRQTVWASVSRAVRTPTRYEHDLNISNVIGLVNGSLSEVAQIRNKDFDSEDLTAWEVGYRNQVTPAVAFDGTAFYNEYRNLSGAQLGDIVVVNNGVDPVHFYIPLQAVNNTTAETAGFELVGSWNVSPDWKLSAGYSFLNIDMHAPRILGLSQETDEDNTAQNQLNLRSYWNVNDRLTLDTMVYYVDNIPGQDLKDAVRLDVNVGWKIQPGVRFNLVGQNLLDDMDREYGSPTNSNTNQAAMRSIYGKFTLEF